MENYLKLKSDFVFCETLKIHQIAPGTRIASSLSCIEILVSLYYGKLIIFDPENVYSDKRDRVIISKGHGSICLYPILADNGFFKLDELKNVGKDGSFLGTIPDPIIPGYETINGSLGHGLGVATGVSLAMKKNNVNNNAIVLCGDGELYEGSNWEAIMFAAHHCLDNITLIVDFNKASMLDFNKNIIDLTPLEDKFSVFGWNTYYIENGHNVNEVYNSLKDIIPLRSKKPKVVIVNTIKGNKIKKLLNNPLSHILSLNSEEIDVILSDENTRKINE
ncbi:transketolase [Campylobacter jejuni]|uniref:Transketolase n=1 Tax=Campylobacter jejuni TaxID=197 RepID=A0A431FQ54_CAMJU|nr:1-deoxy-D-xylulose-5-phosphate synthase N-terminal domain-containing protein [Campylobacter jejuni]ECL9136694.1 transketolase [Campylobacter jejuni]ECR1497493.1 transketolase [Campylobacter jejuni]MCW1344720.1 transketolase [Campylobacter jejuni]MCW1351213.1 transketolase [Campylobacter jejuni]MCW1355519.1 transketolase [Campylobacter jejuni]